MALPSLPGGAASKIADLYEAVWTVDSLLDLLAGDIIELHLEPQGEDGLGVEFYRVLPSGDREYHSVKRQAPGSTIQCLDTVPAHPPDLDSREEHSRRLVPPPRWA